MYHIAFRSVNRDVQEIVQKMLIKEPSERITTTELLNHSYFVDKCGLGAKKNLNPKKRDLYKQYQ